MFKPLDTVIHSPLRLSIISLLASVNRADFNYILTATGATKGNVSVQLKKLKKAGYIDIRKTFKKNYPHTSCSITAAGRKAFDDYVRSIQSYIQLKNKDLPSQHADESNSSSN